VFFVSLMVWLGSTQTQKRSHEGLVQLRISVMGRTTLEQYNASHVSLLNLLRQHHNVSYNGRLKCLDGLCDSNRYFWRLSVNNEEAALGVQQYTVMPGDNISLSLG